MPEYLTVSQLSRLLPGSRGAKYVTPSTVTRWITDGCPARSGEVVKLKAVRIGHRWMIDPADWRAFTAALTGEIEPAASR